MATLVVVLFSVSISGFAIYLYVNNILSQQILKDNSAIVTKLTQQLSYYLDDIKKYSLNIILNDQVQDYLKQKDALKDYDYYSNVQKLVNTLNEYTLLRDNIIDGIYIVDHNEKVLMTNNLYDESVQEDWYKSLSKEMGNSGFSAVHVVEKGNVVSGKAKVVSYVEKIYDKTKTDAYLGKIIINIKYDVIMNLFKNNNASIKSFLIYNHNKMPIYQSNPVSQDISANLNDVLGTQKPLMQFRDNYFITQHIPESVWTVIGVLPAKKIYQDLKYLNYIFLFIMISCFLIMSIVIFPVIKSITKPLLTLVRGMKAVSRGELDTEIDIRSGDEIEELSNVFNKMVKDIKKHIDELLFKEKREREMELRIFMSQINPHFIYNTLNTIIYLGRKVNSDEIITVTRDFIRILQNTIKTQPDELTTIQKEMEYINSYIAILKYRYNDLVELVWDVDEELENAKILRMLVYPLVENSVFHGIFPKGEKGTVKIIVSMEYDKLKITIEDNGIGMSGETLAQLVKAINESSSFEHLDHIGLHNVNHRLKLLFGPDYFLHIESQVNKGTRIWFNAPLYVN